MTSDEYLEWGRQEYRERQEGLQLVRTGAATLLEVQKETKRRRNKLKISAGQASSLIGITIDHLKIRRQAEGQANALAWRDGER